MRDFPIVHQTGHDYELMSTPESRTRLLNNPRTCGHVEVYEKGKANQRDPSHIHNDAREIAGADNFYVCTHWEGRVGYQHRYWRVLVENP